MKTVAEPRQLAFSVDTHLLRELGALLVGRDSTALLELVKNSYDADATAVTVHAEDLANGDGRIVVSDNGLGMTMSRFETAFLRIAGRSKESGTRRSPRYGRRFTGAKGIGRLAAHKLSSTLEVTSVPDALVVGEEPDDRIGLRAVIQWDAIENEHEDLNDLGTALEAFPIVAGHGDPSGTTMALEHVRGEWPGRRLSTFLAEVRSCRPSDLLTTPLPDVVLTKPLLFNEPIVRDTSDHDPGFDIELTGDLAGSEHLWQTLGERSDWILEIDADRDYITYGIAPTMRKQASLRESLGEHAHDWLAPRTYKRRHPSPNRGPFLQARVFITEGSVGRERQFAGLRAFEQQESGIRVYLEGFRVLPYGGRGDDWLRLDADHVRRRRDLDTPDDLGFAPLEQEGFVLLGNRSHYGAVFLTEDGTSELQSLVNREGFVPDEYFNTLVSIVRTGPDLVTRTRAAIRDLTAKLKADQLAAEAERRRREAEAASAHQVPDEPEDVAETLDQPPSTADPSHGSAAAGSNAARPAEDATTGLDSSAQLDVLVTSAERAAQRMRADSGEALNEALRATLLSSLEGIRVRASSAQLEQTNLRALATVGAQYSGFIHEINGLLGQAQTLRRLLAGLSDELAASSALNRAQRSSLRTIISASDELVLALTRQASYLTDVVGPDARRRRTRLPASARIEAALRLLTPRVRERDLSLTVEVDDEVRTPPMFAAELSILVTNLMSNAIKFAGDAGRIRLSAWVDDDGRFHLLVENTGVPVAPHDWERFFRPFESSTTDVDILLGQGMGLGLPIVRNLAEDYGGSATFIGPSPGFATAVEAIIPDPRPGVAKRSRSA